MKRIFSFILAIMLSCSIALAEIGDSREMTSDEQAYNIYLDIAHVYEYGVRYLEEMGRIWEIVLDAKDVAAVNNLCYMDCFTQEPLSSIIEMHLSKYGYKGEINQLLLSRDVFAVSEKTDLIWIALDIEIEAKYVEPPATLKVYLDRAMSNIRTLMATNSEYPFLSELQTYYKDAVMLYEYIADFKDNYTGFTGKLDTYKTNKSSWGIDFEFIFDPVGYPYVEEVRKAQQDEGYKTIYEQAVAHEANGDYESARANYWLCSNYEDAFERMSFCTEKINAEIAEAEAEAARIALQKLFPAGTSFATPKDEFAAKLGIDVQENAKLIRAESDLFESASAKYYFKDENKPLKLTSVYINLYGNTSTSTAQSTYQIAYNMLSDICGTPFATNQTRSRPTYNELKGNTANLISGPAYKDSDFDGNIVSFAEWLLDAGEYYVNVIVYNKQFPAHKFYEIAVLYEVVPYDAVE